MRRHLFSAWLVLGSAFILGGTSWALRPVEVQAPAHVIACFSQVASLEAAFYVAQAQECPNLGVQVPVPPPTRRGR